MHRRAFLQAAAGVAALPQAANTSLGEGIRLGFDTYTVRAFHWKDTQLLDYAASLQVDTIQISDSGDYTSLDPEHLQQVRDYADRLGIRIDAGIGCICPISKGWNPKHGPARQKG